MKGDMLISHAIFVGVGLVSLILLSSIFFDLSNSFKDAYAEARSEEILSKISMHINELCKSAGSAFAYIDIPEKISGDKYTVKFASGKISIEAGKREFSRNINTSCRLEGYSEPPLALRYADNVIRVERWQAR